MLETQGIAHSYGDIKVLRDIDLEINQGQIVCLLGPSGCGKTTFLRVIAGLEQPDSGDVLLDGESILTVPVHQRGFGLMFQDYALFPHMDVAGNVRFGLRMAGESRLRQTERLTEILSLVGLSGFEHRDVNQLSGGEQQRVALARSLAPSPRLLMLDEPLGSLDASLRDRLIVEVQTIIKHIGLTALYITHDQNEAFAIADRIAIMNDGLIEQTGTPEAVYRQPGSVFVAHFLGLPNVVPVFRQDRDTVHTALGSFRVTGQPQAILLHPDTLRLVQSQDDDTLIGYVRRRTFRGDSYRLDIAYRDDLTLTLNIPSYDNLVPQVGDQVYMAISPDSAIPLLGEHEQE